MTILSLRLLLLPALFFAALFFSGCYGTAIDTRSISAEEVTISQNTTWLTGTTLTISAKGWHSDVRAQPMANTSTGPEQGNRDQMGSEVSKAGPVDSLSRQETPGASAPESGKRSSGRMVVGSPDAPAPGGNPLSNP